MKLRETLRTLKVLAHAVWIGARDREVALAVRLFGLAVAAYAFSPIDLIPDFIPVLGLLDDAIIVPLGIWLFVRMITPELHARHVEAAKAASERPLSRGGAIAIVAVWITMLIWGLSLIWTAHFY